MNINQKVIIKRDMRSELEQCIYNHPGNLKLCNIISKPNIVDDIIIIELASDPRYLHEVSKDDIIKVKKVDRSDLQNGDKFYIVNRSCAYVEECIVKDKTSTTIVYNSITYNCNKILYIDNAYPAYTIYKPVKKVTLEEMIFVQLPTTKKELNELKKTLSEVQTDIDNRLNFIQTSGTEEFDENLYKVYTAINTFQDANASIMDKAKAVVEVFRD